MTELPTKSVFPVSRYLALESMCILATSEFSHEAVKKHQETVINALKTERDVSVRQRAVDLLYAMCDKSNAEEIVLEMLAYLETADYSIRFSTTSSSSAFIFHSGVNMKHGKPLSRLT